MIKPRVTHIVAILFGIMTPIWAQPLQVKQHRQGFTITQNDGDVLARIDHGTYDEAMAHNPVFREWVTSVKKGQKVLHQKSLPLREAGEGTSSPFNFLSDSWSQDSPYNQLCPLDDTVRCKVGCVATALSQVMYYYRYPLRGNGIHTYTDTAGTGQTLTADFGAHEYEWSYMLGTYRAGQYTQHQADAVALLNSDAGIAVDMRYGVDESGAYSIKQPIALTQYFGYDRGIRQIFRDFYSRNELYSLLIEEMEARRPVLCSGYGIDGGGHAFVIDGYDAQDNLFHINWGWGGYANGFYNIDYMNSHQPEWNHFRDRRENGANIIQSYTIGIQPDDRALKTQETHEYAFSHLELYVDSLTGDSAVVVHNLANVGWNEHQGAVALALCATGDATPISIIHQYGHPFELEELTDTSYTDTIYLSAVTLPFTPQARLMPVYQEPDGTWREARTSRGIPNYLLLSNTADGVNLHQPSEQTAHLTLDHIEMPDTMVRWQSPKMSLTITNDSEAEYCGRVYIAYQLGDPAVMYVTFAGVGLYLQAGATETLDFRYSPIRNRADSMHVCVFYDIDLFTDSIVKFPVEKDVVILSKATAIAPIGGDKREAGAYPVDLQGRRVNTLVPNQIIISEDGKKRSIQNVP